MGSRGLITNSPHRSPPKQAAAATIDGRSARRQNNRRRIVDAMLALVRAGAIAPGAEQVAARAEVGLRTVFRHFEDMDALYREMAQAMEAEIRPFIVMPFASTDGRERILEVIDRRVRVFEKLMLFKNAADVHRHRSAFLKKNYQRLRDLERSSLRNALPQAISADPIRFEALDLLLSLDIWQRLRCERKLSIGRARATLEFAAAALFAGLVARPAAANQNSSD